MCLVDRVVKSQKVQATEESPLRHISLYFPDPSDFFPSSSENLASPAPG